MDDDPTGELPLKPKWYFGMLFQTFLGFAINPLVAAFIVFCGVDTFEFGLSRDTPWRDFFDSRSDHPGHCGREDQHHNQGDELGDELFKSST